jgi:molybdenum cofactor biosynthesis protein MoaC
MPVSIRTYSTNANDKDAAAATHTSPISSRQNIPKVEEDVLTFLEYLKDEKSLWRREMWQIAANIKEDDLLLQNTVEVNQEMLAWWVGKFTHCRDQGLPRFDVENAVTPEHEESLDLELSSAEEAVEEIKEEEDPFRQARLALKRLNQKLFFLKRGAQIQGKETFQEKVQEAENRVERWSRNHEQFRKHLSRQLYFYAKGMTKQEIGRKIHLRMLKVTPSLLRGAVQEFNFNRSRLQAIQIGGVVMPKHDIPPDADVQLDVHSEAGIPGTATGPKISASSKTPPSLAYGNLLKATTPFDTEYEQAKALPAESSNTTSTTDVKETGKPLSRKILPSLTSEAVNVSFKNNFKRATKHLDKPPKATATSETPSYDQSLGPKTGTHLTHLNASSEAHMVNVGQKESTHRTAVAKGVVHFSNPNTFELIKSAQIKKGDVLSVARVAGIMAAKNCPALIPLCHPIALTSVTVDLDLLPPASNMGNSGGAIEIEVKVECVGPTGVEMEALTAVAGASLTIIDMIKAVDRAAVIGRSMVVLKTGGRSGEWVDEEWKKKREASRKLQRAREAHRPAKEKV